MAREISSICVYCGAAEGSRPAYREAARLLGQLLATEGLRIIYGGGHVGLMGTVADAALAAGGQVTGVIPQQLIDKELGHRGLTELRIVRDMHERKQQMASMADAFIALPGGWGTLEELTEMLTWLQLGFHDKPVGLLNVAGYFDHLLAFAAHMEQEGFLRHSRGDLYQVDGNAADLLERLRQV